MIQRAFSYVFEVADPESTIPKIELRPIGLTSFDVFGLTFESVLLRHGRGFVYGYRFAGSAYLTDHSEIPEETEAKLHGMDVLFIDALRHKPHPTHTSLSRALRHVEELKPKRAFFTHISHDLPHEQTQRTLPHNVCLAYDGLKITLGDAR